MPARKKRSTRKPQRKTAEPEAVFRFIDDRGDAIVKDGTITFRPVDIDAAAVKEFLARRRIGRTLWKPRSGNGPGRQDGS